MTISDCDQKYLKVLEKYIISQFKILDLENVNYRYTGVHFSEDNCLIETRKLIFKFIVVETFKIEIHFLNQRANIVVYVNNMRNLPIVIVSTIQDAISYILFELAMKGKGNLMKTYTEIYDKFFRNITIYPFVPEGTILKGFEGNIVISLLDLTVRWNFTLRVSISRDQWKQLDTAMQRAFDITDWNNEDILDYIRGQQNEQS